MPRHDIISRGGFTFHGSFASKILAARREKEIPGSFIHEKDGRYYVLKPKSARANRVGHRSVKRRVPHPTDVRIYQDITRIEGTKGKESIYPGEKFFHNFKRPFPEMIGLPDGSLLIRPKRRK
jgi:hypothetical protein